VHTIAHAVARGATRIAPTRFAPTAAVSFSPDDGPKVVGKQLIAAIAPLGKLQISCFSPVDRFELSSSIAVSYPAGRARTKRST
jgi:hypothetical protein